MPTGEGGKSNFADTGGYGGNFNAGGGGLYNQSASFGGNPTTVSGGVGDYGANQAAASRLGSKASSMNASANNQMKANGYVLNQNGVWVTPGSWLGVNLQPKTSTTASTPTAVQPPPAIPIPVTKPPVPGLTVRHPPNPTVGTPERHWQGPFDYNSWARDLGDEGSGSYWDEPNSVSGGFMGHPAQKGNQTGYTGPAYSQSYGVNPMNRPGVVSEGRASLGRQFGGPVAPGGQYTVGENGPETLQMGANGGGQVIPHNPTDRLGGMGPQMSQQLFQMMRQFGGGQGQPGMGQGGQPGDMRMRLQQWMQQRGMRPMGGGMPGTPPSAPPGAHSPGFPTAPGTPQPPMATPLPAGPGQGGGQPGGGLPPGPGQQMPGANPNAWGFGGSGMGMQGILQALQQRMGG